VINGANVPPEVATRRNRFFGAFLKGCGESPQRKIRKYISNVGYNRI